MIGNDAERDDIRQHRREDAHHDDSEHREMALLTRRDSELLVAWEGTAHGRRDPAHRGVTGLRRRAVNIQRSTARRKIKTRLNERSRVHDGDRDEQQNADAQK